MTDLDKVLMDDYETLYVDWLKRARDVDARIKDDAERASQAKKEVGHFVTLGEGGDRRIVFMEGPGQGAGSDEPSEVLTSETPLRDEMLANTTRYESGYTSYRATVEGEGFWAMLSASNTNKISPDQFDPDTEFNRVRFTLNRIREILRDDREFVEAIDDDGYLMTQDPDRRISYNIVFTANDENVGAGSGGPGSAKVFYVPYDYEGREDIFGLKPWDRLGLDPIYVTAHETHHAFGSGTELDLFSDTVAIDVHLKLGNTLVPQNVQEQLASMIRWASRHASGEWKEDILKHREAVKWLALSNGPAFANALQGMWEQESIEKLLRRIARW